jgi:hypothetical protein
MTGSFLVPIVVPIVAFITLAGWLGIVYRADAHPGWKARGPADPPEPESEPDLPPVVAPRSQGRIRSMSEPSEAISPLAHLYSVLADVQRDQVASQLEEASTNDLKAIGVLGAVLAIVVALLVLRATDPSSIGYWWWYPLPIFVVPTVLAATPLRRSLPKREFSDGPSVPEFLARYEKGRTTEEGQVPYTLEYMLQMILVGLQESWRNNDSLLAEEQRSFYWGAAALGIATLVTLGLYAWGLS